ncbi:hypothetical protein HGA92_04965 [Candidatus Gracilibacteria bacterium]|nr:hypothetical protein [Candidatus Gracilibacteria bacterium]NUJ98417.1 hypothetical protein [Candidatus Gracilibacteria bacterium]
MNSNISNLPRVGFFGTGEKEYGHGGSGIEKLLEKVKSGDIQAIVALIVSNYSNGGVKEKADKFNIPFHHMTGFPKRESNGKFSEENLQVIREIYQKIIRENNLEYVFLSGLLNYVAGLKPHKTVNVHPGPTQEGYGGKGMYGMHVHRKIWEDYKAGKINQTCVTMHYVTDKFDDPKFTIVQVPVTLEDCNSEDDVKNKVNKMEHIIQWKITQMVISEAIKWTGNENDKIEIDTDVAESFKFLEGTVFGGMLDLQGGISYENRLI